MMDEWSKKKSRFTSPKKMRDKNPYLEVHNVCVCAGNEM